MATITKRGPHRFQARIRRKGNPTLTRTFYTRAEDKHWGSAQEHLMNLDIALGLVATVHFQRRKHDRDKYRAIDVFFEKNVHPASNEYDDDEATVNALLTGYRRNAASCQGYQ